jgi:type I restriction enzyme S subunit
MKDGWEIHRLGEICEISTGKSNTEDAIEIGEYAFFDRSKVIKRSSKYLFNCDAIIIAGEGQTFLPKFYSGKFDLHQRAYAIYNFHSSVCIFYVYKYLIHFHKYFEEVAVGATAKSLRLRHFTDLQIPFPPLPEQKRIVAVLDEAFTAITKVKENAEKNLQNVKELFESYLQSVFANRKWERKTIGDVCDRVEYGSATKSKNVGKIAVLRMGNIQNGRLTWDKLVYSDNKEDNKQYLLKYNDVLFNRTNSPELVGKTAIYKGEIPAIFAGYLIRIHRKENLLDADYLNYYLNSEIAMEYGKTVVISSVNQANINGTKLKTYPIPLPPLTEQKVIVKKLDELSTKTKKLESIYKQKLNDLEELKKSILQKAFNGEL